MKVGIAVYCKVCDHRKKPRGRSAPMGLHMCDWECRGYDQEPQVGDLWPGETEEDFGYPCSANGTEIVHKSSTKALNPTPIGAEGGT